MGVRARLREPGSPADFDAVVVAPFGAVGIRASGAQLEELVFLPAMCVCSARTVGAERVARQVEDYLAGRRWQFDGFELPAGTDFRRQVWRAIAAIAPGATRTYGEIAAELGSAPRAVGQACGDNPLPLLIPCHRVVAASSVGGFAHSGGGFHQRVKLWLLAHEAQCR
ncbi:MAG: methylated-DNA--[protein]-cysteine S-methyltransferase [Burkholderiaceae bacterium]